MIYNAFKLIFFCRCSHTHNTRKPEYHSDVKRFAEHQAVLLVISGRFSKILSRDLRIVNSCKILWKIVQCFVKIKTKIIQRNSFKIMWFKRKRYVFPVKPCTHIRIQPCTHIHIRPCAIFFIFHVCNFCFICILHFIIWWANNPIFESTNLIKIGRHCIFNNFYVEVCTRIIEYFFYKQLIPEII